ncbi:PD-(D/E)XK nuclease family transposase [Butyrivibrio sp. YAB3001]|uniref:PD-(D/E)XK nuclease family transposase n=1 Tax=Butyrivibrio sp. YAB3001 TaxID=1520812 RepID=UPI0008F6458E|nr:PD-(D/E)XK nuclease family transposase [Butyrivibrio sp. YAB3001]SFB81269.1 conserved hypothetical protein (putative transposase or invertase) [Butyrivibrio sp. YAB3001]
MNKSKLNNRSYQNATGTIEFSLTSDLVLHYVMQQSKRALIRLVCSLKGIKISDVLDIKVENPIDLNSLKKETVMDLKLLLNNGEILNIELQMYTDKYWIPRSVLYLCRAYDCIKEGDNYSLLKPTTHFCITNQDLFLDSPEFYSKFMLLNTKTFKPYTKNIALNVLQLNHTELATDDDIANDLVYWAKLFNATTWEEFRVLAKDNEAIEEVGNLIYTINTDDQTREILEGQRRYREQSASQYVAGYTDAEEKLNPIIEEQGKMLADNADTMAKQKETIAQKNETIAQKDQTIADMNATITNKDQTISDMNATITNKYQTISDMNAILQKYKEKYGEL